MKFYDKIMRNAGTRAGGYHAEKVTVKVNFKGKGKYVKVGFEEFTKVYQLRPNSAPRNSNERNPLKASLSSFILNRLFLFATSSHDLICPFFKHGFIHFDIQLRRNRE